MSKITPAIGFFKGIRESRFLVSRRVHRTKRAGGPIAFVYIVVYTFSRPMSERAKIFQNGGSQAVRLPKSFRFSEGQDEVIVRRVGKKVILEPADEWPADFLACLGAWHEDIPKPPARPVRSKRNPFQSS